MFCYNFRSYCGEAASAFLGLRKTQKNLFLKKHCFSSLKTFFEGWLCCTSLPSGSNCFFFWRRSRRRKSRPLFQGNFFCPFVVPPLRCTSPRFFFGPNGGGEHNRGEGMFCPQPGRQDDLQSVLENVTFTFLVVVVNPKITSSLSLSGPPPFAGSASVPRFPPPPGIAASGIPTIRAFFVSCFSIPHPRPLSFVWVGVHFFADFSFLSLPLFYCNHSSYFFVPVSTKNVHWPLRNCAFFIGKFSPFFNSVFCSRFSIFFPGTTHTPPILPLPR